MPEQREKAVGLPQKKLEALWSREMGLPLQVVMVVLVLSTYCVAMTAIGVHNLVGLIRRKLSRFF